LFYFLSVLPVRVFNFYTSFSLLFSIMLCGLFLILPLTKVRVNAPLRSSYCPACSFSRLPSYYFLWPCKLSCCLVVPHITSLQSCYCSSLCFCSFPLFLFSLGTLLFVVLSLPTIKFKTTSILVLFSIVKQRSYPRVCFKTY